MGQRHGARSGLVSVWRLRRWLPGVLAAAAGLTGPVDRVLAQPATMPAPMAPGAVAPTAPGVPAAPATPPEKTYTVTFDKMPWDEVLDWYAKETGLTLITTVKPTGSVTIKPGKDRKFTIGEVTDLINEAMTQQKFILIRRQVTFTIIPADERIPGDILPRVALDELPKRGRTEIVQVILPLKGLVVADVQEELRRLLTPFGTLVALEQPNALLIQDTVGNIVRIQKTLDEVEVKRDDSLNYVCKYRKAQEIADILTKLMTDKETQVTTVQPGFQGGFQPGGFGPGGFQPGGFDGRGFGGDRDRGRYPQQPATNARVKTVQIAVDARRNAVLVTAPVDKIGLAKKLIEEQDKPLRPGDKPIQVGEPVLRQYTVPTGTAEAMAKTVQARMTGIQVIALPAQNQIMVLATPEEQFEIAQLLDLGTKGADGPTSEFIPLNTLTPGTTAATLVKLFPTSAAGGPTIEPQTDGPQPGIHVKGTAAHITEVKKILSEWGEQIVGAGNGGAKFDPTSRTINLGGNTNAAVVAEILGRAMEGMGKKVIINDPLNPRQRVIPLPPAPAPGTTPRLPDPTPPMKSPKDSPLGTRQPLPGRDPLVPVAAQIVDPEKKDDKPIVITVTGDKLIIQSEDTKALEVLAQLARYVQTQGNKADENLFKVIRLKYVAAEDAARELTEIFNGPQQQPQQPQQGGGRFNPLALLGLGGGGAPAAPAPGRIRVVAERMSNSVVVVKASPIDLLLIEKLLAGAIDAGDTDSAAVMKTFVLPVKNADAAEMAAVVREVFRTAMSSTGGNTQVGTLPFLAAFGGGRGGRGGGAAATPQQPPALSVSVDDRSNSLVLLCAETLYEDIKTLVNQLDSATVSTTEVVQLVQLKGVDPNLVQQAINALQGIDSRPQMNTRGGFGNRGSFGQGGFGNFGGGGFGGGGFPGIGGGGFGGGGFPAIGGGGNRGGGGGNRGGGGGNRGGGNRGGGRQANLGGSQGGPLNFDYRGKEAPSAKVSTIYDPQTDAPDLGYNRPAPARPLNDVVQAGATQPPMMPQPVPPYGPAQPGGQLVAPRGTVSAIPIDELGAVVLRATNPEDLRILLELIDYLQRQAKDIQPKLDVVYLDHGDCNSIATTLNAIFSRVQLGPTGNYVPAQARTPQFGAITALAGASPTQNVYVVALPRFNALLIAAPEGRFNDVVREMRRLLDQPNSAPMKAFPLKKASAQIIAAQLQNFWNSRYPGEPLTANQFRVTFDVANNTVFVQGSPGDLKDAEDLIALMDVDNNRAVNEMRVFYLRNAFADELGQILSNAISSNVVSPIAQAQQTGPVAQQAGGAALFGGFQTGGLGGLGGQLGGGGLGGLGGQLGGGLGGQLGGGLGAGGLGAGQLGIGGLGAGGLGAQRITPINVIVPTIGTGQGGGLVTKTTALKFFSARDGRVYESGHLEDVRIVSNARINSLIVSAPEPTMRLIEKLIDNLDTVSAARSYVNVFRLQRADATLTANLLAQLFTGQGRQAAGGLPGGGLQPGGAAGLGGQITARPILTLTGDPAAGAGLIDLRLSVDDRTNSLIVAGSRNDLDTINAIIQRLEGADQQGGRYSEVIKLRNAAAADVQITLQNFFTQTLTVYSSGGFTSAYQQLLRNVVVVAEPVSNTVLISATPQYFDEVKRIIERIDSQPPQVVIQVTIAEVQLTNAEELGVEFGVQSPVLFQRGGLTPGFNFNTTAPLPNSGVVGPGIVGFQGLNNLNVGRSSSQGFGGFVFSASSDAFTLLIRALKAQGRVDVLSRPQVQVADSQTGFVQVGQDFPYLGGTTATVGVTQQDILYRPIGVTMRVTPRVNPDGKVLMRVEPQVSSITPTPINLGNGLLAPAFNVQTVQTTVLASDGETIVLGGLISKQDTRQENGIPYFKDIPYAGALFRYRTHTISRREVLIIMTPHIIRSELDHARILAEESAKMKWCLPEVARIHTHGMEVMGPAAHGARPVPTAGPNAPQPVPPGPGYFAPTLDPVPLPAPVPGGVIPPTPTPPGPAAPAPGTLPPPLPGPGGAPIGAAAPGGVSPAAASQPAHAQPGFTMTAPKGPVAPPIPTLPPPMTATGVPMTGYPVVPAGASSTPAPGATDRGYRMVVPTGAQPYAPPPRGQDAPPADRPPTNTAKEGGPWTFDLRGR